MKESELVNTLSVIYQNVYVVDSKTSQFHIYRMSNRINSAYKASFSKLSYEQSIELYVKNEVDDEDKYLFNGISTAQKVWKILENQPEYSFFYKVIQNGEPHYYQCMALKASESQEFVIGFRDADSLMRKWLLAEKKLKEMVGYQAYHLSILRSIAEIYLTMHYIDFTTDSITEISTDDEVRELFSNASKKSGMSAAKIMKHVMENVTSEKYLKSALKFTDLTTIQKRMKDKKSLSVEFLGKYHGWVRATFITVETDDEEIPLKLIYATQVINDEKNKEKRLEKTANTDELTECLNRHAYEKDTKKYENKAPKQDFAFVSIDVNGLKNINDTLGHEAGDELLTGAASCLKKAFGRYGKIYRTGGDEFYAVLSVKKEKLEKLCLELDDAVARWSGSQLDHLSLSCGYVHISECPEAVISEIESLADKRMYRAKAAYYEKNGMDRRTQQQAFDILCKSYAMILKANLTSDDFSIIHLNSKELSQTDISSKKLSFWLDKFGNSKNIYKDDAENYLEKTDIRYLRRFFESGKEKFALQYRHNVGGEFHTVLMEVVKAPEYSDENQIVYLYVKCLD